jgi:hypothetical protein
MRFHCMNRRIPQLVYLLEVFGEHIWMLVILGRDVLLDGFGKRDIVRAPERQREEVPMKKLESISGAD